MNKISHLALVLSFLSAISFFFYGYLCLFTDHMKLEFTRYGLGKFRKLTAILEILGGLGILVGLKYPIVFLVSTSGLSLLMLLGVIARLKSKDKFVSILPAIFYFTLNLYLAIYLIF